MYQKVEEYFKKFQEKYPRYQSEKLSFFSFGNTEEMADELSELVVKKNKNRYIKRIRFIQKREGTFTKSGPVRCGSEWKK